MEDLNSYHNLLTRRSVKAYTQEMPPKELIEKVIEAGLYAPSGMNRQPTKIIAVTNPVMREQLVAANAALLNTTADPFYGAPVILIVLADRAARTYLYDGSLVMGNLMQAAHDLGLGSCWIHRARETFDQPQWRKWLRDLGIDDTYEGIGQVTLGYPKGKLKEASPRKENRVLWVE